MRSDIKDNQFRYNFKRHISGFLRNDPVTGNVRPVVITAVFAFSILNSETVAACSSRASDVFVHAVTNRETTGICDIDGCISQKVCEFVHHESTHYGEVL